MNVLFVGIGLSMLAVASGIAGIGRYDGVLGADKPESFLDSEEPATFRVKVLGSPEDASRSFLDYREQLVIPDEMRDQIDTRQFVPVEILADEPIQGFLEVWSFVPEPGDTLVVSGNVRMEWALFDTGTAALESLPVLFIHPEEYHEPLIFKR